LLQKERVLAELQRLGEPTALGEKFLARLKAQLAERQHHLDSLTNSAANETSDASAGLKKSPVREEVHRALIMTRRLGGGVPLVAVADREELIGYNSNIMLHRTIFKTFMSIASETRPLVEQSLWQNLLCHRLTHLFPFA
jgi:hypothetical protein